jgi:hypothetical protein
MMLIAVLVSGPALADMFGGDNVQLTFLNYQTGLFAENIWQGVQTANQILNTAVQTYRQIKTIAGYADDAYNAYQTIAHLNGQRALQDAQTVMYATFPGLGYFANEAQQMGQGFGAWAQGSGQLDSLLRQCYFGPNLVADDAACVQLGTSMGFYTVQRTMASTFGKAPTWAPEYIKAVDFEHAVALTQQITQTANNQKTVKEVTNLLKGCELGPGESGSPEHCQYAAERAQVLMLRQTEQLTEQVMETNRLLTVAGAAQNAKEKMALDNHVIQQQTVLNAIGAFSPGATGTTTWAGGSSVVSSGSSPKPSWLSGSGLYTTPSGGLYWPGFGPPGGGSSSSSSEPPPTLSSNNAPSIQGGTGGGETVSGTTADGQNVTVGTVDVPSCSGCELE